MRRIRLYGAAALAALAAVAVAVTLGVGSSHREAPLSSLDPTGDDTDLYAFTAKDAPGAITIVSNWIPFEDPAGGPNFYRFDDRARYYLNVDNTGDGRADVRYRFTFKTTIGNKETFLYALPGVTSINDAKLNVKQTYKVERLTYRRREAALDAHGRGEPPGRPEQRRAEDVPELQRGGRPGGPHAARRRQGVRRPARGPVLRRPRRDVRRHQPPQRHRQRRRRQGRPRGLRRALDRPAGPRGAGHARRAGRRRGRRRERRRRRLGLDGAAAPRRSPTARPTTGARSGRRSRGSATR